MLCWTWERSSTEASLHGRIKDFSGLLEGVGAEAAELRCPRGGRVCTAGTF